MNQRRVRGLAFLLFVAHFASSVFVIFSSMGNMAFVETGPQPAPNRLLPVAEGQVLPVARLDV